MEFFLTLVFLFLNMHTLFSYPTTPLTCTDTTRVCTSFLAFKPSLNHTLPILESMFDVLHQDITVDKKDFFEYVFVKKNCFCAPTSNGYLTNTTFTVKTNEGSVFETVNEAYMGLAMLSNSTRKARYGAVVSLHLLCGCSSGLWNYLMSYVLRDGDSIESLSSRFGVSMDSIESVNGIVNPDNVTVGALYYIPLNSVPGEPYPLETEISPTPVPEPSVDSSTANQVNYKSHFPYAWTIGGSGAGLLLIFVIVLMCISFKSSSCCHPSPRSNAKNPDGKIGHKFHILGRTSFCCTSGRSVCVKSKDWKPNNGEPVNRQKNIPKGMGTEVFDMEKPVVFTYEEIIFSTDSFADSNLLGHGTYGSVYYALLRDQEVAIKRMTAMKTKEFLAEMKVLCKVHHANLVELIGYAASDDELFLIYEYAQKGSLRSHLHDPQNKGNTSLSWIVRVQIALDTARGLEYIHEHTKTHYVHRDIKTSNILIDSAFRGKVSDFGLAKLVGKTSEGEASATRVVGTFGYLAPEYLSDGLATTKSDVYAFGVVLFELISGKEAITRTDGLVLKNPERRSLASIVRLLLPSQ
ncbi:hypothetical protein IFM89_027968 [Coptis chinensis]|uniref:LysM domain receptor-like kinase 3 n=1 Tax=Coptis chinensis TaxID=261450 RepID=A0A835M6X9_9MAGN|nr:hypothetical protein IFM89_027968 [Coptis chinensis]